LKRTKTRVPGRLLDAFFILFFTVLAFAVMGYHPGIEDDGVYLSAIKADLDPSLYPYDSDFFRLQSQATVFDRAIAGFVQVTRIPVAWTELLWQLLSIYAILWAAHSIAQKLFPARPAQWAGVAFLAAMLTLPVAGTALYLADEHLHPRNVATALVLLAVDRIVARRPSHATPLLLLALAVHPIMAACGISLCFFLALVLKDPIYEWLYSRLSPSSKHSPAMAAALLPGWIFESPTPAWRRALETRRYYFLNRWTWYEWLGALGPLILLALLWVYAFKSRRSLLARFVLALLLYGIFQQMVAMILLTPSALVRLTPLQPMRYLHLVYLFLVLMAGCLFGQHFLRRSPWRWALFLLVVNGGMFASQRLLFAGTEHLELPGRTSHNPWLQAFTWIRQNTPADAYFALDPYYLAAPGEDFHSFRALAERSQLADALKDAAVVTQVPELGLPYAKQVDAQSGWSRFQLADFERLKKQFGVGWVLVSYPQSSRLMCIWHNDALTVCRIP
jgi:hypothetical protein